MMRPFHLFLQRCRQKLAKYSGLIDDCKQQFRCQAELLVIIVSSLGKMPSETIECSNYNTLIFARRDIEIAKIPSFIKKIGPYTFNIHARSF